MQPADNGTAQGTTIISNNLVATRIDDDLEWGQGDIRPQTVYVADADQHQLIEAVLQSIQAVGPGEAAYSLCTDGRLPVRLLNDEPIPVREQMVVADIVSAFYVAEVLGATFYADPAAPVADRVTEVAAFLKASSILPSSHLTCGAAAGFTAICQNLIAFAANRRFAARRQQLLPDGIYDETLHRQMLADTWTRLVSGAYDGLSARTFLDAVGTVSGPRAIAELQDDGRGVQGHVEEAVVRIRLHGQAINVAQVSQLTGSRQVFGVNDSRIERLARLFGRGDQTVYRQAYMALEDFADAGHGTLAKGLPTWVITAA